MPRKERSARQTLAEKHFAAFKDYEIRHVLDRQRDPFGAWSIDEIAEAEWKASQMDGVARDEYVRKVRRTACAMAAFALEQADEDYQRQIERMVHRKRTDEALDLIDKIENFLFTSAQDRSLYGVRHDDFKIQFDPQWNRTPIDNDQIDKAGRSFQRELKNYVSDRVFLNEGGTATQFLAVRFAERIVDGWNGIFCRDVDVSLDSQAAFAVGLWNDMNFPSTDEKASEGTDMRWMSRYLKDARKKICPSDS